MHVFKDSSPAPSALAASGVRLLHLLVLCSLLQVFIISAFSSHKQKSSTCIARILVAVRDSAVYTLPDIVADY
jgi:hypothetical protein